MPVDGTLKAMDSDCDRAWREFKARRIWSADAESQADYVLLRLVKALRPSTEEWRARQAVVQRVEQVLAGMPDFQPRYGDSTGCLARVVVFGSFCSSLYHKASDLDLTITGMWRNKHGQLLEMHRMGPNDTADMLHRIKRALMARCAAADPRNPPTVVNARVPLVMYTDAASGVSVDISVCNHGGAFKSRFTLELVQFDARFEALYRLVKLWAEVHALNDPKAGTLNSWSLTQMVIFHLQRCRPQILPPLWLLFHNEPPQGLRPLEQALQEQQQLQQQQHSSGLTHRQRQQQSILKAGAPYSLLKICEQQRQRYQAAYNSHSSSSSNGDSSRVCEHGLMELLAGFFVRFYEVLRQWLEYGCHRDEKMCTWLGTWHRGGARWQHEYLAAFEDPFDAADNTARTLGTASRHDGGCWKLLEQLSRACHACTSLTNTRDLDALLLALFETEAGKVLQSDFDPIVQMLQCQQQQQQQQQQYPAAASAAAAAVFAAAEATTGSAAAAATAATAAGDCVQYWHSD